LTVNIDNSMKAKQEESPETERKRKAIEETLETHKTVLKKLGKL
jgi:hypothetical protein